MGTMIQIRNVPDALHRRLKSRAALAGMSLSDYLLGEIRQVADRPTLDELRARLHGRTETTPSVAPADAVHLAIARNHRAQVIYSLDKTLLRAGKLGVAGEHGDSK
jgi:antitoxin FitA